MVSFRLRGRKGIIDARGREVHCNPDGERRAGASAFERGRAANPNYLEVWICQDKATSVTANDTDPEGNYPLTVTDVGVHSSAFSA